MAGEENRVTVVIDGKNDAGGAFAAATAEAKAFQKAVQDGNRASIAGDRASQAALDARSRAWLAVVKAVQATRDGEQLLTKTEQDMNAEGDRGNGIFSRFRNTLGNVGTTLSNVMSSVGQAFGGGGIGSFFTSWGGIAVTIGALLTGIAGLIPMIVAAGGGIAAMGVLAMPVFSKITAGFSAITGAATKTAKDQAWDAIPKSLVPVEKGLIRIDALFGRLSSKLAPSLMPLFNDALKAALPLLRGMLPFAQSAAKALDGLMKSFDKFATSPGFKQFQAQMLKIEGPAITTLGVGIGKVVIALGKLLIALSNPNMFRAAKYLFEGIAAVIGGIALQITVFTRVIVATLHGIAVAFDYVRHQLASDAHAWASDFDIARHAIATFGSGVASTFDTVRHALASWAVDTGHFVMQAVSWFQRLPGMITSALSSLPGILYSAGQHAIQSLVNGMGSMLGAVGSMASAIASKVAGFFGLSPAREGPLSGGGSPFIRGQHFTADLAAGMTSGRGALAASAAGLAGAMGAGAGHGAGGAGGGHIVLEVHGGGGSELDQIFATWLRKYVRVRGGNVQAVFGRT